MTRLVAVITQPGPVCSVIRFGPRSLAPWFAVSQGTEDPGVDHHTFDDVELSEPAKSQGASS